MLTAHAGLDILLVVTGVGSLIAGALLARRAVRNAATAFVTSWFVLFGLLQILVALDGRDSRLYVAVGLLLEAAIISFGIAFASTSLSTRQRWAIVWAFIPAVALAFIAPARTAGDLTLSGLLAHVYFGISLAGVPAFLAWRWTRERGAHARSQIAWVLVPLAFWLVHDGLVGSLGFVLSPPAPGISEALFAAQRAFAVAYAVAITATVAFATWLLARSVGRTDPETRVARRLGVALLAAFPVSLLQFVVPASAAASTHFVVDTITVVILFYGVARYRILDIDLTIRWGVRQGTIAAFFVATFFVVSEAAQEFLGETLGGTYVGIAAAGALVFALAPLQRVAERVSARAVPVAEGPDAYLAYRRLHIYRAAMEGALRDGAVEPREQEALRALRRELGVTEEEHALLERDLRDARESPTATAPA